MDPKTISSNSEKICCPFDTLRDLLECKPCLNLITLPLQPSSTLCVASSLPSQEVFQRNNVPKTLFCHDMAGGYLEDKYINGCDKPEAYRFFNWPAIDIFVYFSHHFITIPPPGWINAAHLHGVPVLGTFITEWDDGKAICSELFSSRSMVDVVIDKLISLTLPHFDGWLINIENELDPTWVPNVIYFLKQLQTRLKEESDTPTYVIWYDSVTHDGKLDWQNELNEKNKNFFDACDGIFLNYCWREEHLERSKVNAGAREFDIFVGVDVFGRGCLGGGGFNTSEAVEIVRKKDLSVAIFAPGWVYETLGTENFLANELQYWRLLKPYLYLHSTAKLPLRTYFCQGFGPQCFENGKVNSPLPWYNLTKQNLQPSYISSSDLNFDTLVGINGGGCLNIKKTSGDHHIPLVSVELPFIRKVSEMDKIDRIWVVIAFQARISANFGLFLGMREHYERILMKSEDDLTILKKIVDDLPSLDAPDWLLKGFWVDLPLSEDINPLLLRFDLDLDPDVEIKIGFLDIRTHSS